VRGPLEVNPGWKRRRSLNICSDVTQGDLQFDALTAVIEEYAHTGRTNRPNARFAVVIESAVRAVRQSGFWVKCGA
jgi:hypothetical protein